MIDEDLTSVDVVYHMNANSILLSLPYCCPLDMIATSTFLLLQFYSHGMRQSRARLRLERDLNTKKKIILIEHLFSARFAAVDVQQILSTVSEVPRIACMHACMYKVEIG